jgi:hypothetical protein
VRNPLPALVALLFALVGAGSASVRAEAGWQPQPAPLMTRWAADVSAELPHPEHPRPQLRRDAWLNLNGPWDYAIRPDATPPTRYDGPILVPFPVESALSGVMRRADGGYLWYRRTFEVPVGWSGDRVWLHFGAVDWEATVWIDGTEAGTHRGGYDPFSFDVTDLLADTGDHELVVRVRDPSDQATQPSGKQVVRPHGIWYTPSTGIWQTVWLESVPATSIERLRLEPGTDALRLTAQSEAPADTHTVRATALVDGAAVASASGAPGETLLLAPADPRTWSPDSPFLYDLRVELLRGDDTVDVVDSYFGLRSVALGRDDDGVPRLTLNGEVLFHFGTLDQGFWPDGLYTAPTDDALRYDIEATRALGFNTIRKHVKVEPARWYYWADRLGVLVWQDMPNGGGHVAPGSGEYVGDVPWAAQFELELLRVVDALHHHPSVVMWVLFNEGWGQHDTARLTSALEARDPTRLVNSASGWNDLGTGSVLDVHAYPGPAAPPRGGERAPVLGEFGGLGLPIPGHTWQDEDNWGYRSYADADALTDAYVELVAALRRLAVDPGLAAAIYTQTTDVEVEVNGLLTYDRALVKMDAERVRRANEELLRPLPRTVALVPTSEHEARLWRWTVDEPGAGWADPGFDDAGWAEDPAGFGTPDVRGSVVRTPWQTPTIWLRTTFELDLDVDALDDLRLRVHHDEDVDVFLNGQPIVMLPYSTFAYVDVRRDERLRAALRPGSNVLAARARHTWGGRYIDIGLYARAAETHEVKP